ncbi:MAG: NUDIX hydrolase [Paracoccus sp. (in: a-proteobacteria)]
MTGDLAVPLSSWREGDDFSAAKLVLTCEGDLLVCLRDDFDHIPFPGHWDLPGGGREGMETAPQCALRELYEEFGLRLDPARLESHLAFPNPAGRGMVSIFHTGILHRDEIAAIRFGDEGQCWRMMPVQDYLAHPKAVPHFRNRIAHCLGLPLPD